MTPSPPDEPLQGGNVEAAPWSAQFRIRAPKAMLPFSGGWTTYLKSTPTDMRLRRDRKYLSATMSTRK
eukprot:11344994-Alexandrium_andersonii.AAC.1